MNKLAALALVLATGCLGPALIGASVGVHGPNPFAVAQTAIAVATIATIVATQPPVVVDVGYAGESNPGYVWVNGRQTWNGNAWLWSPGYWQPDRAGYTYVQGAWEPRGDQYVWVDGYWAEPRQGYVYVDGYYDYADTGYVWRPGRWETDRQDQVWVRGNYTTTYGSRRTYQQGHWEGRSQGGPVVRDHR